MRNLKYYETEEGKAHFNNIHARSKKMIDDMLERKAVRDIQYADWRNGRDLREEAKRLYEEWDK